MMNQESESHFTIHHLAPNFFVILVAVVGLCLPSSSFAQMTTNEVFVLGTLYKRHEAVPGYDLAALQRTILAIKADVLVLDVTPSELEEQKVVSSKVEYSVVIFPLVRDGPFRVYAGEPVEPMFSEIVQSLIGANKELEKTNPGARAIIKRYNESTYEALSQIWLSPADVNSEVTERIISGKKALEERLVGVVETNAWKRWNHYAVSVVLQAVQKNPGKRILVITGIENCPGIRGELRDNKTIKLIDMEPWLRSNVK